MNPAGAGGFAAGIFAIANDPGETDAWRPARTRTVSADIWRTSEDNIMAVIDLEALNPLREKLASHPIYASLRGLEDLRVFMRHHLFSVWDFISLIKYLQAHLAPCSVPWMPMGDPGLRRFINELVLAEESDLIPSASPAPGYLSHFELYLRALDEIGGDGDLGNRFLARVREQGLDAALYSDLVPLPCRYFTETTFCFIRENKPHEVAAALVLGREQVIPDMFRRFIEASRLTVDQAPRFHDYLERHRLLDGQLHGPLSLHLLDVLCADDPLKIEEAETAAEEAICARLRFWDGVLESIETERAARLA